jgi:hypothetical protein
MKKSIFPLVVFAVLSAMLTISSCSNDNELANGTSFVREPVKFGVGLSKIPVTRATTWSTGTPTTWATSAKSIGNFFASGDKVAIITFDDTQTTSTVTRGFVYETSAASGSASAATALAPVTAGSGNQAYWSSSTETKKIIAWSYGTSTAITNPETVPTTFTVTADQSDDSFNEELLWGFLSLAYTDKGTAANYDIPMYHQLALVNVNITATDATEISACYFGRNLTSTTTGGVMKLDGTFAPPFAASATYPTGWVLPTTAGNYTDYTGSWSNQGSTTTGYITPRRTASGSTGTGGKDKTASYSAVVMPCDYTSSSLTLFEITVDGITYKYIPATATFAAGNVYTYDVTVGPETLTVTASIKNWNDGGTTSGLNAVLD